MSNDLEKIRKELVFHLKGGNAHIKFDEVVADFPAKLRGTVPKGLPYSAWQLLEHLRIAQEDILQFCLNHDGSYSQPSWPDGYWPQKAAPPSENAWDESIKKTKSDLQKFVKLINDSKSDLLTPFPWGDGQTLLREAIVIVDHNSYHLGEIVAVRRALNTWPPK